MKGKSNKNWKGGEFIYGWVYNKMIKAAEKRKHHFDISMTYLEDLFIWQEKKCALSGLSLGFGRDSKSTTASLDRIDSSVGYIEGNVQWVHKDVNMMKQQLGNCQFIEYCRLVANNPNNRCPNE